MKAVLFRLNIRHGVTLELLELFQTDPDDERVGSSSPHRRGVASPAIRPRTGLDRHAGSHGITDYLRIPADPLCKSQFLS